MVVLLLKRQEAHYGDGNVARLLVLLTFNDDLYCRFYFC
jgi:hypothetical protein